ncbi:hypothetical protein NXV73_17615 [Bacteroides salyersiae]|nr:hypothetical protein [Bacteroides salyersiae]
MSSDSIILLEKELEPKLEADKRYDLLFYLKQLVARAYANRGDITVAVDKAHIMYQKAKEMEYDKGIALSLRAIGDVYPASNIQQQAIDSYEEAIRILDKSDDEDLIKIHILPNLILSLLKIEKNRRSPCISKATRKPCSTSFQHHPICFIPPYAVHII